MRPPPHPRLPCPPRNAARRVSRDATPLKGAGMAGGESEGPSACSLCRQPLGTLPLVHTTVGGMVHVTCADRQARQAWRWRTALAVTHLVALVLSLVTWGNVLPSPLVLLAFLVALAASHVLVHRRWWYFVRRDLRRLLCGR